MAYINFKEEVYAAKKQLKERNDNNKKLTEQMKHEKYKEQHNEKYSFKNIKNRVINNSRIEKEDEFFNIVNENIVCAHFTDCKFYNIRFFECSFIGCTFENCDFGGGGVLFENCTFIKYDTDKTPSLNIKDNLSCTFINCSIYAKFLSSDISYAIFESCIIKNTSFELTDASYMIADKCEMQKINIMDSDLSGIKVIDTYIEDLEFNDKVNTKMNEKSFFDKIKLRKKTRDEYEGIYMIYQNIGNEFRNNNLNNNFGEYYYLGRCNQRKTLDIIPRIISIIEFLTCGYGERVFAPLFASLVLCIIFAVLYLFIGIKTDEKIIKYGLNVIFNTDLGQLLTDFNVSLKISLGIFSGMGEDIAQTMSQAYIISDIETVLGVMMIGLGIGTLTRKIIR